MKHLIIVIICIMTALPSFGKLRFKMLEINDSTTVITLKEKNMHKQVPATASKLYNDGKTYEALEIQSGYENRYNVYKLVFPRQTILNNTKIELTVDNKLITEDIWEQISTAAFSRKLHYNASRVMIIESDYRKTHSSMK